MKVLIVFSTICFNVLHKSYSHCAIVVYAVIIKTDDDNSGRGYWINVGRITHHGYTNSAVLYGHMSIPLSQEQYCVQMINHNNENLLSADSYSLK